MKQHQKQTNKNNAVLYKCPECGLEYQDKAWALKCEVWCKKNNSCNLAITDHAQK